ncbi:hypothetical protein EB061_00250 [bacterium]|nr:hypothetical protein [bacterium]
MKLPGPAWFLLVLLNAFPAHAARTAELCFDFNRESATVLGPEPDRYPEEGKESAEHGWKDDPALKERIAWAKARGSIDLPLAVVLKKFQEPMTTRDPETTRVNAVTLSDPNAILKQRINVSVKPVFFITLEWVEEWLFNLLEGTTLQPKRVLIRYQKTEGFFARSRHRGQVSGWPRRSSPTAETLKMWRTESSEP